MRVLLVALLCAGAAWGQVAPVGSVVGEVKDSSGAVVAGATVVLTNSGTQSRKESSTSTEGRFAFNLLPVGSYQLHVTAQGFSTFEQTGIRVNVDSAASVTV